MLTYEERIREWGTSLKHQGCKAIFQEGYIITLVVKDDISKIRKIKSSPTITVVAYMPEQNSIGVCVYASNDDMSNGLFVPILLGNKIEEEMLIKISNGYGKIEFFSVSDDLSEIYAKEILREEMGRFALNRELRTAGLIV
ncbi:hypothetical protein C1I91_14270 [Clostridium manihotivorum]|uniref:Uncharacterized protein n=1 Tax=Clostridium manihotivorum TaxID=2320868 RepID=A0A3R5TG61_9CLOT|nr:hypothetical protein C1I91_14270 [Clostridium manihotivorum]